MSQRQETPAGGTSPPGPAADIAAVPDSPRPPVVLVAEDNPINQQLIAAQLKLIGFATVVADNGREALALWRQGGFALLLTDLQMPEMDGYQLAASVRNEEVAPSRLPIVALTANSREDESKCCRAVGMDDYLVKPVSLIALEAALGRLIGPPAAARARPAAPRREASPPAREPVGAGVLAALLGDDDPATLRRFFVDFAASALQASTEMQAALDQGRPGDASLIAHRIKGTARSIGAMRLGNLCTHVESAAGAGDGASLTASVALFRAEVELVREWLDVHRGARAGAD